MNEAKIFLKQACRDFSEEMKSASYLFGPYRKQKKEELMRLWSIIVREYFKKIDESLEEKND